MQKVNDFLSIVLKSIGILLIGVVVAYLIICIVGNISINHQKAEAIGPSTKYAFTLTANGRQLLTDNYIQDGTNYKLDGFYSLNNGKWVWSKGTLTLDEKYSGPIVLTKR